jgi:NADH dehydrogenase
MRVVVLGGGYAGLTVVRRLERLLPDSADLVLVDDSGEHLLLHELHRVVRRPALAETITLPLGTVVSRATVREARVTDIDTDNRVVTLADGDLGYDIAAVCLGSETAVYDLPGVEEHAIPLKRVAHAREIRQSALAGGQAVVGGAGLSGVQVAGELAALADEAAIDLDVSLVEAADQVAPGFGTAFADALGRELDRRGVTVETGVAVESTGATRVELADGRTLRTDTLVWTGGIRGPAALGGERVAVGPDLEAAEGTFVLGDASDVVDTDGAAVPASAQTAVRQARVAATTIARRVRGEAGDETREYTSEDLGWVVSVGDGAVARVGNVLVNGESARAAKAAIGAGHLGSLGALTRASSLTASELGLPEPPAACGQTTPLDAALATLPTDPAVPGQVGAPLVALAGDLTDAVTGGRLIDLTY